jgi:uncharacterized protein YbjQ (UPF0145 family)/membrane protein implicated in regulation of membrane protease activity
MRGEVKFVLTGLAWGIGITTALELIRRGDHATLSGLFILFIAILAILLRQFINIGWVISFLVLVTLIGLEMYLALVAFVFVGLVLLAFRSLARGVGKSIKDSADEARNRAAEVDDKINSLRSEITVLNGSIFHGKEIKTVLGAVTGSSQIAASSEDEANLAEKKAMLDMMEKTKAGGGNAVIDAKLTMSTFEKQGSKWQSSKFYYTGTAVRVG